MFPLFRCSLFISPLYVLIISYQCKWQFPAKRITCILVYWLRKMSHLTHRLNQLITIFMRWIMLHQIMPFNCFQIFFVDCLISLQIIFVVIQWNALSYFSFWMRASTIVENRFDWKSRLENSSQNIENFSQSNYHIPTWANLDQTKLSNFLQRGSEYQTPKMWIHSKIIFPHFCSRSRRIIALSVTWPFKN